MALSNNNGGMIVLVILLCNVLSSFVCNSLIPHEIMGFGRRNRIHGTRRIFSMYTEIEQEQKKANLSPKPEEEEENEVVSSSKADRSQFSTKFRNSYTAQPATSILDDYLEIQTKLNPNDDVFRSIRKNVPLKVQYFLRDSGFLRFLLDRVLLVFAVVPEVLKTYPTALSDFLNLSGLPELSKLSAAVSSSASESSSGGKASQRETPNVNFSTASYGPHSKQVVHVLRPVISATSSDKRKEVEREEEKIIAFVHGGAWGSGSPAMYRLVATPFLLRGLTVVIIGYRTYPTTDVEGQIEDVTKALEYVCRKNSRENDKVSVKRDITLIGHSSGAHISMMGLLRNKIPSNLVNRFVALSGVYDIPSHYMYESKRGVERFSPMACACGSALSGWKKMSPTLCIQTKNSASDDNKRGLDNKTNGEETMEPVRINLALPPMLISHGAQDDTVPCKSAINFYDTLCKVEPAVPCTFQLLEEAGHTDYVFDLMFGGPAGDAVLDWLRDQGIGSTDD